MKFVLVINLADDVAEAYEDFTVDYDLRGTPKEDRTVNESIKYIEDAEPKPLPPKLDANDWHRMFSGKYDIREAKGYGWNVCRDVITGEAE